MPSDPKVGLSFGIEIEWLVKPDKKHLERLEKYGFNKRVHSHEGDRDTPEKNKNRAAIRAVMTETIQVAGYNAGTTLESYTQWIVVDEKTLDEVPGFWRVELVSPVLDSAENWQLQMQVVIRALRKNFEIHLSSGCSMHIHVSPGIDIRYTLPQLQGILKAVVVYDYKAITAIVPGLRKDNPWAVPNVKAKSEWHTLYHKVEHDTWEPLFRVFDKHKMRQHLLMECPNRRDLSWNFSNVLGGCGTIEFRRPRAVDHERDAIVWSMFTLGFISYAITHDWNHEKAKKTYCNTDELRHAVRSGIQYLSHHSHPGLGDLSDNHEPPYHYTDEEKRVIKEKKKHILYEHGPFAEVILRSRPNTPT